LFSRALLFALVLLPVYSVPLVTYNMA